jgi:hypothetical protein
VVLNCYRTLGLRDDAIDYLFAAGPTGSKFNAVNTRNKNFTRGKVERRGAQLEKSVVRYLTQFDTPTCRSCRKSWRRRRRI